MYNIKTLNKIAEAGIERLDSSKYTCSDSVENQVGILVRSADMHSMERNPELLCIARAGAGVNNIPLDACSQDGVVVFNTPGANANAVKELVICALFLASRKIVQGIAWAKTLADQGDAVAKLVEKGKSNFVGPEIRGKKLGVIGLGAIGAMVANTAEKLGMDVYGYDPYISIDAAWSLSRKVVHARDLKTIFENCDYITLHVPATDETRNTICAETLKTMKKGVRIINLARAELVDTDAMLEALESGQAGAYVTDFADSKLLACDNVVAMPHLGASTPESEDNCAAMAVDEMTRYIELGTIKNSVNYPYLDMDREGVYRICVLHKNVPKMVGGVTNIFAEANINIENMANRAKKDNAYTVIDTNTCPDEELLNKIRAIEGVVRVRVLVDETCDRRRDLRDM